MGNLNIRKIAEKAGVSVATVSRVLNHPDRVAQDKREHVLRVMAEYNYAPNYLARALNLNKTHVIGLVMPDIGNPIYVDTIRGADEVAYSKGYNTLLCTTSEEQARESEYIAMLLNRKVDGLLLASSFLNQKDFDQIKAANLPYVYVGSREKADNMNIVRADLASGAYEAIHHLLEQGCERLAFLRCSRFEAEDKEISCGVQKALAEAGLQSRLTTLKVPCSYEGGHIALQKLLQTPPLPDAVFAASDPIAIGFAQEAKQAGLKIPGDISLVGFDGLAVDTLIEPKLSTVEKPAYRMGLLAARLLFDLIETEDSGTHVITLPTTLKIRKS